MADKPNLNKQYVKQKVKNAANQQDAPYSSEEEKLKFAKKMFRASQLSSEEFKLLYPNEKLPRITKQIVSAEEYEPVATEPEQTKKKTFGGLGGGPGTLGGVVSQIRQKLSNKLENPIAGTTPPLSRTRTRSKSTKSKSAENTPLGSRSSSIESIEPFMLRKKSQEKHIEEPMSKAEITKYIKEYAKDSGVFKQTEKGLEAAAIDLYKKGMLNLTQLRIVYPEIKFEAGEGTGGIEEKDEEKQRRETEGREAEEREKKEKKEQKRIQTLGDKMRKAQKIQGVFGRRGREPIKAENVKIPEKLFEENIHLMKDIEKLTQASEADKRKWSDDAVAKAGEANIKAFENRYGVRLIPDPNPAKRMDIAEYFQYATRYPYIDPRDPSKKPQEYRYLGSGKSTQYTLYDAIYFGVEPINPVDDAAKRHDIQYALAGAQKTKIQKLLETKGENDVEVVQQKNIFTQMVQNADAQFLDEVEKYRDLPEYKYIVPQINMAIKSKNILEAIGLFDAIPALDPVTPEIARANLEQIKKDLNDLGNDPSFASPAKAAEIEDAKEDIEIIQSVDKGQDIFAGQYLNEEYDIKRFESATKMFESAGSAYKQYSEAQKLFSRQPEQKTLSEQVSSISAKDIGVQGAVEEIQKNIPFNQPYPNNMLQQPVTGERNLAQQIPIGDNPDVIKLTQKERRNNLRFFTRFMHVAPTNANQQLFNNEISDDPNNSLVSMMHKQQNLQLNKDTYVGDIKVVHRVVPNIQQIKRQKIQFINDTNRKLVNEQHFFLNGPQRAKTGLMEFARETGLPFMTPKEKINNIHQRLYRPIIFNSMRT